MSTPAEILVVEDEPALNRLLCDYLQAAGYRTRGVLDGAQVLPLLREHAADLVVLDLMLPGLDGLSLCRALRADPRLRDTAVLMVTARVEEIDRLLGLESGADDYVCKPFSPREVVARVKAILRRPRQLAPAPAPAPASDGTATGAGATAADPASPREPVPGLRLEPAAYRAWLDGQALGLTPLEFRLLAALAAQPGRVYSRDQLLDRLHDDMRALSDRAVDSHVKNLRRKLERARPGAESIRSVYGVGYALALD